MSYSFRERRQNANYAESNDHERDPNDRDPDYSISRPRKSTRGRNNTPFTSRAAGRDLLRRPTRGRRRTRLSNRTTVINQENNETDDIEHSSNNQRGSLLGEGSWPTMDNGSPPPPTLPEVTNSNMERASLLGEGSRPSRDNGLLPPPTPPEVTSSNMQRASFLGESSGPSRDNRLPPPPTPPEVKNSNMQRSNSFSSEAPRQSMENNPPPPPPPPHEGTSSNIERCSREEPCPSMEIGTSLPERTTAIANQKTILSLLIDLKLVVDDQEVYYMDNRSKSPALTGIVTRAGIFCDCCQGEISVWTFEIHAGSDHTRLKDCLIAAWQEPTEQKRREMFTFVPKETSASQHDSACSICGYGGDVLICCRKCPSAFHAYCMNMARPRRGWLCPYCVCKFCRLGGDSKQLITCSQCEKKFHLQCFSERSKDSLDISSSRLYCGQSCKEIYEKLDSSIGTKTDICESCSWRVIHTKLHDNWNQFLENNLKVAVAYALMDESFQTIIDQHTGINLVQSVLYSCESNLTRLNFTRFHTFILEKDDTIICAASIRIAEMPFVATDKAYRRQGICAMLMMVVESFLCNLEVQILMVPSIPDTHDMWKQNYGFNELSRDLKKEIASYNNLMFPGAVQLYKDLTSRTAQPDGGNGNKDKQVENQNAQEAQKDQAEGQLLDLNMEAPEEDQ